MTTKVRYGSVMTWKFGSETDFVLLIVRYRTEHHVKYLYDLMVNILYGSLGSVAESEP